ncbi:MFS transporter [Streptomyces nigrescens]|uniref:MFS transporter n=2 Tax=Streptomyces nigrescens TaxID=1920 RepID=A0A640TTJ4_STRNI|nr:MULTISPECIES: MFS transporter [Streptomyces]MCX5450494.1 MFS transporter [Streptomyces libani]WAU00320.1 MFS transporter [Streptomyces libani subsp. libani]WAU08213.1 MFS transporter [Streptomyces nigrescens]GFE25435.1 MFS transporter [Streptomyces libani subsp. libani]GGV98117.1 MFS transporter [Streptomyces libani subsp. libani]
MPTLNKIRRALTKEHGSLPAEPRLARTRIALTAFFAMDGFLFAGWVVRIPAIKAQTGAGAGTLGLALLGVSAGAVAFMMIAGRLCRRFGSPAVTAAAAAALSLSIVLPPLTRSATALGLVLLVFGAAYGALNVAMNSAAVALIDALRRPVMPGFHAAFSLGGMLGAGLGGLLAGSLSATVHLLLLAAVGLLVTVVAGRALCGHPVPEVPERLPAAEGPGSVRAGRARRLVLVFGLIALCTAYGEGAMADWGALHLSQDLGAGPGTAAAGYAVFALAMTVGRLSGTAAVQRFGAARALIAGGTTATAGMLLGALAPTAWAACAGFAVAGLGLANIFPIALARAGETGGPDGVAVASTVGYGGMLLGPPAIGFLAEAVGLPAALTTVALLAALAAGIAYATRGAHTGRP